MHYCYSISVSAAGAAGVKCLAREQFGGIIVRGVEEMCRVNFFQFSQAELSSCFGDLKKLLF